MRPDLLVVAGARPNFVKVKPVLDALDEKELTSHLVHTGQHYDIAMSQVFFDDLGIRRPDISLDVGSGSHAQQTAAVMVAFERLMTEIKPRGVVVFGDVNSTVACGLVAAKCGSYVIHVEAGLRSRDWSMPEEVNRVVTDRISDLLLAPSSDAVENLTREGHRPDSVVLAGNVMIDTLLSNLDRARDRDRASAYGLRAKQYALVTLHRPSNVDDRSGLQELLDALGVLSQSVPVLFPVHPRTRVQLDTLNIPAGVTLIEPLGYLDFLSLQADAGVVVTDSGGVQEETTVLGVPCVTARNSTERPITVTEGTNHLAGTDPEVILSVARRLLADPPLPRCPALWDGNAGARCADAIEHLFDAPSWPRPTDR